MEHTIGLIHTELTQNIDRLRILYDHLNILKEKVDKYRWQPISSCPKFTRVLVNLEPEPDQDKNDPMLTRIAYVGNDDTVVDFHGGNHLNKALYWMPVPR